MSRRSRSPAPPCAGPWARARCARSCAFMSMRAVERREHDRRIADALAPAAPRRAGSRPGPAGTPGSSRSPRAGPASTASRHLVLDARAGIAAEIARLDREGAAFAGDDGRVAQELRDPRAVERRRHGRMRRSSRRPRWQSSASARPEVGVERALVELVEQHRADAGKLGIVEDHAGEDALGDDLDAGLRPGFRDHPRAQSDASRRQPPTRSAPCARRRPARRCGAAPAPGSCGPAASSRPSGRAGRASSCRRRAAPRGRPRRAPPRRARNSSSTASIGSGASIMIGGGGMPAVCGARCVPAGLIRRPRPDRASPSTAGPRLRACGCSARRGGSRS